MREQPTDGVVANPWARRPGDLPEPAHRPGDWGEDPEVVAVPVVGPAATSPTPRYRSARIAVLIATVLSGVELVGTAWAYTETRSAIGDDPAGADAPLTDLQIGQDAIDRLNAATGASGALTVVALLGLLVAAVFVLRWQAVVVGNQQRLGIDRPRYSPRGAGWSWFVPVWALFGPKRALNDAWRAAAPAVGNEPRDAWLARPVPALFGWWWGAWLLGAIAGRGTSAVGEDSLGDASTLHLVSLVSCVATVAAGVLFIVVMEQLTARQEARIAERARA